MENTQNIDPRLADIDNSQAPAQSSFSYIGELVTEEWTFLPLEKRQRDGYVKDDVPYYHVAVRPLSYRIEDGGAEGDNLEHTYAKIRNVQGELTPKGSARDELVQAFTKLGFPRNTIHDLINNPATGMKFKFKRYRRTYKRGNEEIPGEQMNVPIDIVPQNWAPPPGEEVPVYPRAPRNNAVSNGVSSGGVAQPIGPTFQDVAKALVEAGTAATEQAVRAFVLDRNDLAQGGILDNAMQFKLMAKLIEDGLVKVENGVLVAA